jgi:WD40 repeat protein
MIFADRAVEQKDTKKEEFVTMESKHNGEKALLSPDGRFLAVPGDSNTVIVIDGATNKQWVTYYGHQAGLYRRVGWTIKALAWLPDGSNIASGSTDGSIHIWDARTGIHQRTLTQPQEDCAVLALSLSHEGRLTALRGGSINTWQLC